MRKKTVTSILVISIGLSACVSFKDQVLFDAPANQEEPESIENFYSLDIFSDNINGEHWFTESSQNEISLPFMKRNKSKSLDRKETWLKKTNQCLSINRTDKYTYSGSGAMHWKWDKKAGDCPWLGMGFGWDNWQGKDMNQIIGKAAIQLKVRTVSGTLKSLPLAACLEDYSGTQVWIGFSPNTIENGIITEEWSNVILPLSEFEWENATNIDAYNIKQFIVQFEAEGEIYVDEIKVIPYEGGFSKRTNVVLYDLIEINIDGSCNEEEWIEAQQIQFSYHSVKSIADSENLYFFLEFQSDESMKNPFNGNEMYQGDAFEIAFSTNPELMRKRKHLYSSDQHIGINLSKANSVWDWRNDRNVEGAEVSALIQGKIHQYEVKVPLSSIGVNFFISGPSYGIEYALDKSSKEGNRKTQFRWNSSNNEGFHKNPSMWGELIFNK
tara:strand:+ start:19002 stop:20321 length:1320 start_codon:yes stop_codon:yes gene_type:complete